MVVAARDVREIGFQDRCGRRATRSAGTPARRPDQLPFDLTRPLTRNQIDIFIAHVEAACLGRIMWILRKNGVHRDDRNDVFQDTLIKAFRYLSNGKTLRGSWKAWLRKIAENEAMNYHRARKLEGKARKALLESEELRIAIGRWTARERAAKEGVVDTVKAALALLPADMQAVAQMVLEGCGRAEIAKTAGVSLKTVSEWRQKIFAHLSKQIGPHPEQCGDCAVRRAAHASIVMGRPWACHRCPITGAVS
jgi:RNA polymerase sigma factor (sigma-70 family)